MDVSQFELVYKPQSPAAPSGTAAVDSLIQGYFLKITNLETQAMSYRVSFVAAPVTDPLRSLAGNTVVFVDTPGTNNQQGVLNGAITSTVFSPSTGLITVPPSGTALIAVLPSAFGPLPGEPTPLLTPDFEVRGHVRITLPALLKLVPGNPFPTFKFVPQSKVPVKVLLTPQNRTTYFTATGAISDQTQASLPLASGKALNEVPPQPPFVFPGGALDLDLQRGFERLAAVEPEMMAMLVSMAGQGAGRSERGRKALEGADG